jgi:hypothetical protein
VAASLKIHNCTPPNSVGLQYTCFKLECYFLDLNLTLNLTVVSGVSWKVLAGGNKEALSVAQASGLQFIRAEGFVFSHVADEGFTDATAGPLLRYRASIRADNILIFTDIKKKHRQVMFRVRPVDLYVIFPKYCSDFGEIWC